MEEAGVVKKIDVVDVAVILCEYIFFQAEDGIRDRTVTGVQTCALPIYFPPITPNAEFACAFGELGKAAHALVAGSRSEERRVGKECRSWWWRDHQKK